MGKEHSHILRSLLDLREWLSYFVVLPNSQDPCIPFVSKITLMRKLSTGGPESEGFSGSYGSRRPRDLHLWSSKDPWPGNQSDKNGFCSQFKFEILTFTFTILASWFSHL